MKLRKIGYACINLSQDLTTGGTFRLANLTNARIEETIIRNIDALKKILLWNVENDIKLFRIASSFIPFASHPNFTFPWQNRFKEDFAEIKHFVKENGLRLSMHPGQYTVLNSPTENIVNNSIAELEWQAELLHLLDPDGGVMVLHVGGVYGNKAAAMNRFIRNFERLSPVVQHYLGLENDDKSYTLDDVLHICQAIKIPLVFDIFHHRCNFAGESWQQNLLTRLETGMQTWYDKTPKLHISSQKEGTKTSHSDLILQQDFDVLTEIMGQLRTHANFDLMVEAKLKEQAALALL
ncbi:MAG: UV DNA damage repair endonuclease UvsE [Bacteroidia bacterium]